MSKVLGKSGTSKKEVGDFPKKLESSIYTDEVVDIDEAMKKVGSLKSQSR